MSNPCIWEWMSCVSEFLGMDANEGYRSLCQTKMCRELD